MKKKKKELYLSAIRVTNNDPGYIELFFENLLLYAKNKLSDS